MGASERHELMTGNSRLRAHVVFTTLAAPTLLNLVELLTIMHEHSGSYKLASVRFLQL